MSRVRFLIFPRKKVEIFAAANIWIGANILAGRAGITAGTVRQRRRPYKLGGLRADPHLRTAWRRGNITWTRALQPDWEGVRSWRFCRAQIVRVWALIFWAHTSFIGREDFNGRLVTIVYYEARTFLMRRIYFIYAQIFWIGADVLWARIFHGREYFIGANISWARTFWMYADIFHVSKYLGYA